MNPKSNSFLLRKSSRLLFNASPRSARDLEYTRHGGTLRVVIIAFLPDIERLRSRTVRHRGRPQRGFRRRMQVRPFAVSSSGAAVSIRASSSFRTSSSTLPVVRPLRLRFDDLPFLFLHSRPNSTGWPFAVRSTRVSLSASKTSRRLSRRSFAVLSSRSLRAALNVNTLGSSANLAYTAVPVGVSSPISSLRDLPSFVVTVISTAGGCNPYALRSVGFSSTTRSYDKPGVCGGNTARRILIDTPSLGSAHLPLLRTVSLQ